MCAATHWWYQFEWPTTHGAATGSCCQNQTQFPAFFLDNALDDCVVDVGVSIEQSFHVVVCGSEDDGSIMKVPHLDLWTLLVEGNSDLYVVEYPRAEVETCTSSLVFRDFHMLNAPSRQ